MQMALVRARWGNPLCASVLLLMAVVSSMAIGLDIGTSSRPIGWQMLCPPLLTLASMGVMGVLQRGVVKSALLTFMVRLSFLLLIAYVMIVVAGHFTPPAINEPVAAVWAAVTQGYLPWRTVLRPLFFLVDGNLSMWIGVLVGVVGAWYVGLRSNNWLVAWCYFCVALGTISLLTVLPVAVMEKQTIASGLWYVGVWLAYVWMFFTKQNFV